MNRYILTEEQMNAFIKVLGEIPAKISFNLILTLKNLPKLDNEKGVDDNVAS